MPKPSLRAATAILAVLTSGCQAGRPGAGPGYQDASQVPTMTPAAWAQASRLVDRFETVRQQDGMAGVSEDIERCYATTARPAVPKVALRECLILDTFAVRFNTSANRVLPGVSGLLPYFQRQSVDRRLNRYGVLAGFTDQEVMAGYLLQGSNSMFTVLAAQQRA